VAKAFQKRLKDVAGFAYVPDPTIFVNSMSDLFHQASAANLCWTAKTKSPS
jgi:protein gp37